MKLILGPENLKKEFNFEIPEHVSKVGIFLSGGLDSAALLCLILSELKQTGKNLPVQCTTVFKNDGSMFYADKIVKKASLMFDQQIEHRNSFPNDQDSIDQGRVGLSAIQQVWNSRAENTIFYMAVNNMAPDNIRPFSQRLKIYYVKSIYYESPFIDLYKPQILDMIYKLGCEEIIKETHSCTRLANSHCGQCYSCQERQWGFDSLEKTDPILA